MDTGKRNKISTAADWIRSHRYSLLLLYLPLYVIAFFAIERIPVDHYYIIRCPLDDLIGFNAAMVIPYAIWYLWFPGWLFYFLLKSREEFIRLALVMFTGMTLCLVTYVVWPNGVDLRESITGTDLCSKAVALIRSVDTPYGVCPSIHISTITAIMLVIRDTKLPDFNPTVKGYCLVITLLIAWSTMALKQHSIVDVAAGAALSVVLDLICQRFLATRFLRFSEIDDLPS